ncbi:21261_t:CDS:1, partial [Rhizophagus irregularis]
PGHENSSNINHNVVNADLSMINDNNIFPSYTNNNHFNQQPTSSSSTMQSYPPPITSSYAPQYVHPSQPISSPGSFNMASINPGVYSFDIPGFKIIVVPICSQQDNTYINSSSNSMGNQFTQFTQFRP